MHNSPGRGQRREAHVSVQLFKKMSGVGHAGNGDISIKAKPLYVQYSVEEMAVGAVSREGISR